MTIIFRTDSDNFTHQVWAQQQAASCAVASIWMARNQAKQMTFNEAEWPLAWRMYCQVVQNMVLFPQPPPPLPPPMCLNPSAHQDNQDTFGNMFSTRGTYMHQVTQALKNDGVTVTHATDFSPGIPVIASKLSDTKPAIIMLGWYEGNIRKGGHFIIASRVTGSGSIVYLDPWGGQLREMGIGPQYQTTGKFEEIIYISA